MLWLAVVGLIVLSPRPVDEDARHTLRRMLRLLHGRGLPAWFDYGVVEFLANVIMFVPLGLFFFLLAPRGWRWLGPILGLGLSVLIEACQLAALPQRVASPFDVLANVLGTLVGTFAAWIMLRVLRR